MDTRDNEAQGETLIGRRLRRWSRAPLLHFLVGGAVLFVATDGQTLRGRSEAPVSITAAEVEQLRRDYERDAGLMATEADEAALVDDAIDDELLVREAFARGLAQHDRSIRGWLVEQMEALGEQGSPDRLYERAVALGLDRSDLVVRRILLHKMRLLLAKTEGTTPTDAELHGLWSRVRDEYRAPDVVTFWHVFFSTTVRGPRAKADAQAVLEAIAERAPAPAEVVRSGDPFVTTAHVERQAAVQTAKVFGPGFAAGLSTVPVGRWAGPLPSAFGVHLVLVEVREAGAIPAFEVVRERLAARWLDEQRRERLAALVERLRSRAVLDVASDAWRRRRS